MHAIKRYKNGDDYSYTLGMAVTIEMLVHSRESAICVYISDCLERGERFDYLANLCAGLDIPISVNAKAFNVLSRKGNCFVIGVFRLFSRELSNSSNIVLVNPQDAGNLGTIIRTAVGFGLPDIAIIRPSADPFDPKTVRASMGALFQSRICVYESFEDYRAQFLSHILYPFMLNEQSAPIGEISFTPPFSLVFGNEATGLPPSFANICGVRPVIIPQSKAIDSLNLPIAAGIGMWAAICGAVNARRCAIKASK